MGSAFTVLTGFTDSSKPFFFARREMENGFTVFTDYTDFTDSSESFFFLSDAISLRSRGNPPYPIQSAKFIKTLSPPKLFN